MTINAQIILWNPFRRLLAFRAGSSKKAQPRSLAFQLVESEVCVADALLDLGDLVGCDHYMASAIKLAEELRGPENMLMHQRLRRLRSKRSEFKSLQPAAVCHRNERY